MPPFADQRFPGQPGPTTQPQRFPGPPDQQPQRFPGPPDQQPWMHGRFPFDPATGQRLPGPGDPRFAGPYPPGHPGQMPPHTQGPNYPTGRTLFLNILFQQVMKEIIEPRHDKTNNVALHPFCNKSVVGFA